MMNARDLRVERRFKEQEREIVSFKRRNTNSSRASGSGAKQPKKAEKSNKVTILKKQAAIITIPVVIDTSTTEEILTSPAVSQPIALTVEEVMDVEKDLDERSTRSHWLSHNKIDSKIIQIKSFA
jgi:hypothetical protein